MSMCTPMSAVRASTAALRRRLSRVPLPGVAETGGGGRPLGIVPRRAGLGVFAGPLRDHDDRDPGLGDFDGRSEA